LNGNGGVLNIIINNLGVVELDKVLFNGCKGSNGGAIYSVISGTGKIMIDDSSSFTSCESTNGNGGAIYA
jgi:hypothetical protein